MKGSSTVLLKKCITVELYCRALNTNAKHTSNVWDDQHFMDGSQFCTGNSNKQTDKQTNKGEDVGIDYVFTYTKLGYSVLY